MTALRKGAWKQRAANCVTLVEKDASNIYRSRAQCSKALGKHIMFIIELSRAMTQTLTCTAEVNALNFYKIIEIWDSFNARSLGWRLKLTRIRWKFIFSFTPFFNSKLTAKRSAAWILHVSLFVALVTIYISKVWRCTWRCIVGVGDRSMGECTNGLEEAALLTDRRDWHINNDRMPATT